MRGPLHRVAAAGLFAALVLAPLASRAAPCGRPDVDDTFPPHGSENVPRNADLAAHYAAPADYDDEPVTLVGPNGDVFVDMIYDDAESMLRALPSSDLAPGHYVVTWPGLRGVATSRGLGLTVEFDVGGLDHVPHSAFAQTAAKQVLARQQRPAVGFTDGRSCC